MALAMVFSVQQGEHGPLVVYKLKVPEQAAPAAPPTPAAPTPAVPSRAIESGSAAGEAGFNPMLDVNGSGTILGEVRAEVERVREVLEGILRDLEDVAEQLSAVRAQSSAQEVE